MSISTPTANISGESLFPIVVQFQPAVKMSDEQLFDFSLQNRDLQIERNAQGELVIMPPTGGETGDRNAEICMQLRQWAKQTKSGATFDSSTGFRLPNGAIRAPDAAWVKRSRFEALTPDERKKFLPLCPEFVIELRSPTDDLRHLQEKMEEYIANGAELGWLIDTARQVVAVYRPNEKPREVANPQTLSADPTLPGFVLDLNEVW